MKEICVDARMALHSGVGTYIRNILPSLKSSFASLRVLASTHLVEKWPELQSYDLIPMKSGIYTIQEQLELPLRIPFCDLYWSPHYNIPIFPIRARKRVVTIHDVCHLACGHMLSIPKKIYAKIMLKSATAISEHIFTVSQFSLEEIIKYTGVSASKISVIHNGVNTQLFSAPKTLRSLPENYFIFVSNLAPHKNVARLLQAWNRVIQKYPHWHLVLVGRQTKNVGYLKVFDEFPHLRSRVELLGSVSNEELSSLYQHAYALISPSLYEGFGLSPLEAMVMRCPAIVSQLASFPEVCGNAALYVNPFDIEDIAQKIGGLIENPSLRLALIEKGLERTQHFTWERAAQDHVNLIHRILG
jgi:glycosyltransferase involved in cell wall biosynthesis